MKLILARNNINLLLVSVMFIPFSLVLGTLVLNANIFFICLLVIINCIFDRNNDKYLKDSWLKAALLLFIYQIITSVYNDAQAHSILRGLSFVKFIGLSFGLLIVFENNPKNFFLFLKILSFVLFFVLIDSLIQFSFGKNLFGYQYSNSRLTSIFKDEFIVGSFLCKTGFLILILFSKIFKDSKIKNIIIFTILMFILVIILLSGERMASLLFMMGIILFYLIKSINSYKNLIFILITVSVISLVYYNSNNVAKRFNEISHERYGLTKKLRINDSVWGAHFLTAYEIFKKYPVLGVGPKNFRVESSKKEYENINSSKANQRWSTHPHNIILEILSEQGIVGLILFLNLLYQIVKGININREVQLFALISFIIFIWPLGTSGSIFTSWNGTFMWINFSVLLFTKNKFLDRSN